MATSIGELIEKKKMKNNNYHITISESLLFGIFLASVGGFLESYTFISRDGVFANAQTGNIVLLGICAAQGEWSKSLGYLPPIIAFMCGVILTEIIKSHSLQIFMLDWITEILALEMFVLFIVGFIPSTTPDIIVTITISFVSAIQTSSFRKLVDSPYATTMSTGNLRSACFLLFNAISKKDHDSALKSLRFFTIILSFIIGSFFGAIMTLKIGEKSIWATVSILLFSILLLKFKSK